VTPPWLRGHRVVLVDEATQDIVTFEVERRGRSGDRSRRCGHAKGDASVGTPLVVVAGVLPKDSFEMAMARMSNQSRHSVRTVLTQRSA